MRTRLLILMIFIGFWVNAHEIKNLKCENQINPSGITNARPHFSWTFVPSDNSTQQGGYRIMMATSIEKLQYPDIWDTGPTSTSETGPFEYCGEPLKSGQRIYWMVTAWGNNRGVTHSEPAWFEMGEIENPETPFKPHVFQKEQGVVRIFLNGDDKGRVFEGIEGVSAGASTDLLYDYENPIRSQILERAFNI